MRELVVVRFNDHIKVNDVQEYVIEMSLPGKFNKTIYGASVEEILSAFMEGWQEMFKLLEWPDQVERPTITVPQLMELRDENGGQSKFGAVANSKFEAQVYRKDEHGNIYLVDNEGNPVPPEDNDFHALVQRKNASSDPLPEENQ